MRLIVESRRRGHTELLLERGLLTIGRGADCDLALPDEQASRHHAELRRVGDQWLIADMGSTNGTLVDNQRLPPLQARSLRPGQIVVIGTTRLTLQADQILDAPTRPGAYGPAVQQEAAPAPRGQPASGWAILAWFSRALVIGAAVLLAIGSQRDWLHIRVQLPLVGTVFDRTFSGMDSGYGWLLLTAALLGVLLVLVDVLTRRWGMAAGLAQALMAVFSTVALAVTAYSYYRAGSQSVFGISLLEVYARYARNMVTLSAQSGIHLTAAGLGGLMLGGLLRLMAAGMEPMSADQ